MAPNPRSVRDWIDALKDVVLILLGAFILIHETIGNDPPRTVLIGIAVAALGLPIADRLTKRNGNGGS